MQILPLSSIFFFIEIGPKLASSIDSSNKPAFHTYLTRPTSAAFQFEYTTPDSIEKIISNMKSKNSCGWDNISSKLLKNIRDVISLPLSMIINQSLCTGIFPKSLKLAKVIPLYKKGDNNIFGNYRPISLLSATSKIFERVAFDQLYKHFSRHHLFYDSQYGFRQDHSTELAALELIDRVKQQMDDKKTPFSVFLDLSKAFDTLDHDILLQKLAFYGVKGLSLEWFKSYLTGRSQFVEFNGTQSSTKELITGVPQGSILGPLLFIIYMNDVHVTSDKLNLILFADDTTTSSSMCSFASNKNSTTQYVASAINAELDKLSDWLSVNKLSLNAEKTKFIIFRNPQRITFMVPELKINNTVIERVQKFNFLGIMLTEHLTWDAHLSAVGNKMSQTLGIMNRLKKILPQDILLLMYNSLIGSHLNYGTLAWGFECKRITKLQKRAIRIISGSKYNSHTEPLFKKMKLLKISDIFRLKCLKFWYKSVNKTLPDYFNSMFTYNREMYQIETRQINRLYQFQTHTYAARKNIRHFLPQILNEYPNQILDYVNTHSIDTFSKHIRSFILNAYTNECQLENCYICCM